MATTSALRALALEFKSMEEEPVEGFRVKLVNDDNLFEWEVAIFGPPSTLYEGGYFKVMTLPYNLFDRLLTVLCCFSLLWLQACLKFPSDYPYSPPSLKFLTKVWHPNVYEVSLTILEWRRTRRGWPHSSQAHHSCFNFATWFKGSSFFSNFVCWCRLLSHRMEICVSQSFILRSMTLSLENSPVRDGTLHRMSGMYEKQETHLHKFFDLRSSVELLEGMRLVLQHFTTTSLQIHASCFFDKSYNRMIQDCTSQCDLSAQRAQYFLSCKRRCLCHVQKMERVQRKG